MSGKQPPAPSVGCLPRGAEERQVPLGSGDSGDPSGEREGLRGTREQEAEDLYFCLNSEPHPEPGGRGRRGARYSLGLVGEAGGPGLLISIQVTVEHIEAKAAHLR